eukprot:3557760-Prorocentrum_lima.AAC.1
MLVFFPAAACLLSVACLPSCARSHKLTRLNSTPVRVSQARCPAAGPLATLGRPRASRQRRPR